MSELKVVFNRVSIYDLMISKKLYRYIDQGLFAVILFSINLITPYLVDVEATAEILYLSSWVMLWGAFSVSFFGVPIIATVSDEGDWKVRELLLLYLLFSVACFVGLLTLVLTDFISQKNILSVFLFSILWAFSDLFRRSFLRKGKVVESLLLSLVGLISTFMGLCALFFFDKSSLIWEIGGLGLCATLVLFFFGLKRRCADKCKRTLSQSFQHGRSCFQAGSYTFLSYFLAWLATQGLFIVFFQTAGPEVFVEQKWLFSLFGVFGVFMMVQENKFQPEFSQAISLNDSSRILSLDRDVKTENLLMLYAGAIIGIFLCIFSASYSVLLVFLMLVYRQVFGNAKRFVYHLRGYGYYKQIMLSNLFACLASYSVSFYFSKGGYDYAISFGLVVYAMIFYGLIFLFFKKQMSEKC